MCFYFHTYLLGVLKSTRKNNTIQKMNIETNILAAQSKEQ